METGVLLSPGTATTKSLSVGLLMCLIASQAPKLEFSSRHSLLRGHSMSMVKTFAKMEARKYGLRVFFRETIEFPGQQA